MQDLSEYELLKAIYRCVDFERLLEQHPHLTRERVDELFQRLAGSAKPSRIFVMNVDGAARGNPGPAGIGVVVHDHHGHLVDEISQPIGSATNNVAEYRAMIRAAERAIELHAERVHFCVDSQLLARQVKGEYKTKSRALVPLHLRLRRLLNQIPKWNIQHVPREDNAAADALANLALGPK